jgi:hypothetical protein
MTNDKTHNIKYKNKEKHILYKVEKMQRKIQKKLLAASKKSSVLGRLLFTSSKGAIVILIVW